MYDIIASAIYYTLNMEPRGNRTDRANVVSKINAELGGFGDFNTIEQSERADQAFFNGQCSLIYENALFFIQSIEEQSRKLNELDTPEGRLRIIEIMINAKKNSILAKAESNKRAGASIAGDLAVSEYVRGNMRINLLEMESIRQKAEEKYINKDGEEIDNQARVEINQEVQALLDAIAVNPELVDEVIMKHKQAILRGIEKNTNVFQENYRLAISRLYDLIKRKSQSETGSIYVSGYSNALQILTEAIRKLAPQLED